MDKSKKIVGIIVFVVFCTFVSYTLYKWVRFGTIDGGSIVFSFIALSYLLNWLNWG